MKKLLVVLLILWAGQAWGATKYVNPACPSACDGSTWAKGWTTMSGARGGVSDGDKVLVAPGTYTGYNNRFTLDLAAQSNTTWCGVSSTTATDCDGLGRDVVVIAPGDYHVQYANGAADNAVIRDMTYNATSTGSHLAFYLNTGTTGFVYNNVRFYLSAGTSATLGLMTDGTITFNRCSFIDNNTASSISGSNHISMTGAGALNINYSLFQSYKYPPKFNVYSITSAGTVNINNSVLFGNLSGAIYTAVGSTFNIKNSILGGNTEGSGETIYLNHASAVVNIYNSYVYGDPIEPQTYKHTTGTYNESAVTVNADPKFSTYTRVGYIIPSIDDTTDLSVAQGLNTELASRSMKGTFYAQANTFAANAAALNALTVVEPGVHGLSHQDMTATTLGTITQSGCATAPEYNVDIANRQFSVKSTEGGTCDNTYTWADTDPPVSFATVLAAIRTGSSNKWNVTYTSQMSGDTPVNSLSDTAGYIAITTAMALDKTSGGGDNCTSGGCARFYKNEIYNAKLIAEAALGGGYVAKSFANPYNTTNDNVRAAIRTSGYTSARNVPTTAVLNLASTNVYNIEHQTVWYDGTTEANTISRIKGVAVQSAANGLILSILAHGTPAASGSNSWATALDTLKPFHDSGAIKVTDMKTAIAEITASPWTYTAATGATTRTYADNVNFSLLSSSPAINAGVNVGLTTDFLGNPIIGLPDIGAYESNYSTGKPTVPNFPSFPSFPSWQ